MKKLIAFVLLTTLNLNSFSQELNPREYSLSELITISKTRSYENREQFEELYQARHDVNSKIGRLAPNINIGTIVTLSTMGIGSLFNAAGTAATSTARPGFGIMEFLGSFLGFVFPSNWFSLKESKLYLEANKRFYVSAVSNQMNAVEAMVYEVSLEKEIVALYQEGLENMENLNKSIKIKQRLGLMLEAKVANVQTAILDFDSDHYLSKEIAETSEDLLLNAVGLGVDDLRNARLAKVDRVTEFEILDIDVDEVYSDVLKRSPKYLGLLYVVEAMRYAKKKRVFDFISPTGDIEGNIGFGYVSHIRKGESEIRLAEIEVEKYQTTLYTAIRNTIDHYNVMFEILQNDQEAHAILASEYAKNVSLLKKTATIDTQEYIQSMIDLLSRKAKIIKTQYRLMKLQADLERLTMSGGNYENLMPKIFRATPDITLTKSQKAENKKINKALKNGELILP